MKIDRKAGELTHEEKIHQIIRVNQAGEYGAVQIYKGQLSILKHTEVSETVEHMLEQEGAHLKQFNDQMITRRVRPTLLTPLWHVAGFALGAASALLGKRAAMACTVAVEEVIDEHYKKQQEYLIDKPEEADLCTLISVCREEELEHRDIGYAQGAQKASGYPLFVKAVKTSSRLAIWLSKRI